MRLQGGLNSCASRIAHGGSVVRRMQPLFFERLRIPRQQFARLSCGSFMEPQNLGWCSTKCVRFFEATSFDRSTRFFSLDFPIDFPLDFFYVIFWLVFRFFFLRVVWQDSPATFSRQTFFCAIALLRHYHSGSKVLCLKFCVLCCLNSALSLFPLLLFCVVVQLFVSSRSVRWTPFVTMHAKGSSSFYCRSFLALLVHFRSRRILLYSISERLKFEPLHFRICAVYNSLHLRFAFEIGRRS